MPMYNLTEYSDLYSKTQRSLQQFYRDKSALHSTKNFIDFTANNNSNNNSVLFKLKKKITRKTKNDGTKDVELILP